MGIFDNMGQETKQHLQGIAQAFVQGGAELKRGVFELLKQDPDISGQGQQASPGTPVNQMGSPMPATAPIQAGAPVNQMGSPMQTAPMQGSGQAQAGAPAQAGGQAGGGGARQKAAAIFDYLRKDPETAEILTRGVFMPLAAGLVANLPGVGRDARAGIVSAAAAQPGQVAAEIQGRREKVAAEEKSRRDQLYQLKMDVGKQARQNLLDLNKIEAQGESDLELQRIRDQGALDRRLSVPGAVATRYIPAAEGYRAGERPAGPAVMVPPRGGRPGTGKEDYSQYAPEPVYRDTGVRGGRDPQQEDDQARLNYLNKNALDRGPEGDQEMAEIKDRQARHRDFVNWKTAKPKGRAAIEKNRAAKVRQEERAGQIEQRKLNVHKNAAKGETKMKLGKKYPNYRDQINKAIDAGFSPEEI